MDVNNTKYHLLYGCDDWSMCNVSGYTQSLAQLWQDGHAPLDWDCSSTSLRLAREVPSYHTQAGNPPLEISARRGVGRDHDGNWYWINADENSILFLPKGGDAKPLPFWNGTGYEFSATENGTFAPCPLPSKRVLRGLAVTTHNYLVVGDVTNQGLLVFDLYNGNSPLLQCWPQDVDFAPWDLAATPDGGLLVLDREHSTYWSLDANFRQRADVLHEEFATFQPVNFTDQSYNRNQRIQRNFSPHGYPLTKGLPPVAIAAVSIEPGPDGHVLILESDPSLDHSTIYEYDGTTSISAYPVGPVEVIYLDSTSGQPSTFSVIGHDFAYLEDGGSAAQLPGCGCLDTTASALDKRHMIYVADHQGKQAFGFIMDRQQHLLRTERDLLPLRRWQGKGIVNVGGQAYYDFNERWAPLMIFTDCRYIKQAVLTTPTIFTVDSENSDVPDTLGAQPGGPFDSNILGCVWHRLLLDAQIPRGTAITVRARVADDPTLLLSSEWIDQPDLYLRSGGAELPYYDPWADMNPLPEQTGTWEILLQQMVGRYIQIELTIQGSGRTTPSIRALRAWFPRFSYLEHYLPAVYREDPVSASFLERFLANFEGLYTNLEDKIEHVAELFDPRTAPAETLEWLASWFGLMLDPRWDENRRRLLIRHLDQLYRIRGTELGIVIAVRLYIDKDVDEGLFDSNNLPTSSVHIVEQFLTRGGNGLAYGDPNDDGIRPLIPLTPQIVADNAHRFAVLVPHNLDDVQLEMVKRIVELEKPTHTAFTVRRYWELFRIGEARLGLDTLLAERSKNFQDISQLLGQASLADAHLDIPHPMTLADRMVLS